MPMSFADTSNHIGTDIFNVYVFKRYERSVYVCVEKLLVNEYSDASIIRKLLRRRIRKSENVGIFTLALMTILPVY